MVQTSATRTNIISHLHCFNQRKMELRDEILFRQPESSHLGDCPICCLPHSIVRSKAVVNGCCGKLICESCHYSNEMRQADRSLAKVCPFCRHPLPSSEEEARELLMKRVEANDVPSLVEVGYHYNSTGDFVAAFKYWAKAAELDDDAEAHFCLATMYQHGKGGVEKDLEKEIYHLEKAAIAGHPNARFNLGCTDQAAGRTDRAVKHFIIAANLGHDTSLKFLQKFYADEKVSKEEFAATLRAYQSTVEAAKRRQKKETESAPAVEEVSKVAAAHSKESTDESAAAATN